MVLGLKCDLLWELKKWPNDPRFYTVLGFILGFNICALFIVFLLAL